jgi:hypothetical protein
MLRESIANVPVDVTESLPGMPMVKVVLPTLQVPVQLLNQLRDRFATLTMIRHLVQLSRSFFKAFADGLTFKYRPPRPCRSS